MAKLTKPFKFSPDGKEVISYNAGDEVDGRALQVAVQLGIVGKKSSAKGSKPLSNKSAKPQSNK